LSEKLAENIDLCSESKLHWDGAIFEAMFTRETENLLHHFGTLNLYFRGKKLDNFNSIKLKRLSHFLLHNYRMTVNKTVVLPNLTVRDRRTTPLRPHGFLPFYLCLSTLTRQKYMIPSFKGVFKRCIADGMSAKYI
jgi:hypothetical protein